MNYSYIIFYLLSVALSYYLLKLSAIKGKLFEPKLFDVIIIFVPIGNIIMSIVTFYLYVLEERVSVKKFFGLK